MPLIVLLIAATLAISSVSPDVAAQAVAVTFNRDIAPIVFEHCSPCHQPGEAGPFDLLTYRDVRVRATQVAAVTARRIMPPWKPAPADGAEPPLFLDQRGLTSAEIQRIQDWVTAGSAEGDVADRRTPPAADGGEWRLGTPDLVVTMPETYVLPADGADFFRSFVIQIPTLRARYVKGLEFRPGNARAVHHANLGIDRTPASRRLDALDAGPGYAGGIVAAANYPPGQMLGWTPGQRPRLAPAGMQWRLAPESDLVVQLHLQPSGKPEPVRASIGLYFTDEAPARQPVGLRIGSETIDIPAGEREHVVTDSYVLPVDVELLAIQPHAHNLARRMEAVAALPGGATRTLITIADWDFRWQEVYRYAQPMTLVKGTAISMRYSYDNSPANPRNPFAPPRRVVWGPNTSNEMGDFWLQLVAKNAADTGALETDVGRKMRGEDIAASIKLLEADRSNAARYDAVAVLYLQNGQPEQAIPYLRQSLRLDARSASAHYNLALALTGRRQFLDAISEYQEALRLDSGHADAHNSLGALLVSQGKVAEALGHYRQAVQLAPGHLSAHANLGQALLLLGRAADARVALDEALRLTPDSPPALTSLAWVLAAAADEAVRDSREALAVAQRAAALTFERDVWVLDALAAAHASAGDFTRAIAIGHSAAGLATAQGRTDLAAQIRTRIALYERQTPFRLP